MCLGTHALYLSLLRDLQGPIQFATVRCIATQPAYTGFTHYTMIPSLLSLTPTATGSSAASSQSVSSSIIILRPSDNPGLGTSPSNPAGNGENDTLKASRMVLCNIERTVLLKRRMMGRLDCAGLRVRYCRMCYGNVLCHLEVCLISRILHSIQRS